MEESEEFSQSVEVPEQTECADGLKNPEPTEESKNKPKKRKLSKKKKIILIAVSVFLALLITAGLLVWFLLFGGGSSGGGGGKKPAGPTKPQLPAEQVDLTTETQGLDFQLNEAGTGYICTGKGEAENLVALVLPAEHEGLPVTEIADYAFKGCKSLKYAVLPDGLTKVGAEEFRNTALY